MKVTLPNIWLVIITKSKPERPFEAFTSLFSVNVKVPLLERLSKTNRPSSPVKNSKSCSPLRATPTLEIAIPSEVTTRPVN